MKKYCLKNISVASVEIENKGVIYKDVSALAANYLNSCIRAGDIVGVSWGIHLVMS